MDLDLGPEIAQYRAELRGWISAEAPEGLAELTDWNRTAIPGGYREQSLGAVDGDEIVVTGQKVWTSGAHRANMMFVLCRTDPSVPKHAGLSYVLIPFTGPGVQFRPIRQMSGAAEFAEDFLDGVRAP